MIKAALQGWLAQQLCHHPCRSRPETIGLPSARRFVPNSCSLYHLNISNLFTSFLDTKSQANLPPVAPELPQSVTLKSRVWPFSCLCQRLMSILLEGVVCCEHSGNLDQWPVALLTLASHLWSLGLLELTCHDILLITFMLRCGIHE